MMEGHVIGMEPEKMIENDGRKNDLVQPADGFGLTWLPALHNSPDSRRLQRPFSEFGLIQT